jgi:hypothetical protein
MLADMGHGVGQLVLEDGSEAARHPLGRSVSEYFRISQDMVTIGSNRLPGLALRCELRHRSTP